MPKNSAGNLAEVRWLDPENNSSDIILGDSRIPQIFVQSFFKKNLFQKQMGKPFEDDRITKCIHSFVQHRFIECKQNINYRK